ncbi:uncharacterized protein EI90DRAFT_3152271, partial [Cantharellus anzutake]|uniref:uncharacterized protein n=1 Tax=Cantharellus anzutake TaxID=1750568 RepID=UPI0019078FC8
MRISPSTMPSGTSGHAQGQPNRGVLETLSGKKPHKRWSAGISVEMPIADLRTATPTTLSSREDSCLICAEPVKYYAISSCNHRTCHQCALRWRALYKKHECAFCKSPQPRLIFTSSGSSPCEVPPKAQSFIDDRLGIVFETKEMMNESLLLLRFNCPHVQCEFTAKGWADLKSHVRDDHAQFLCDLCIRHKKIFPHEHPLYTPRMLAQHLPSLRRPPPLPKGASETPEERTADVIHPLCPFCKECFYADDELSFHLRERHEECFVCRRLGTRDYYFQNYEKLVCSLITLPGVFLYCFQYQHFRSDHFPCPHSDCLAQKFIVFPSQLDLQIHQIQQHGDEMSTRQKKDKLRIGSVFGSSNLQHASTSSRVSVPGSTTASSSEQIVNINRRRTLGNHHLTDPDNCGSPSEISTGAGAIFAGLGTLDSSLQNLSSHARLSVLSNVRSFQASESSSRDMLDNIHIVFDGNLGAMSPIVVKILDLFEAKKEKQSEVLQSWTRLKSQEGEQFPSLGSVSNVPVNSKKPPEKHVGAGASVGVWNRDEKAVTLSTSSTAPFPSLSRKDGVTGRPTMNLTDSFPSLPPSSRSQVPKEFIRASQNAHDAS